MVLASWLDSSIEIEFSTISGTAQSLEVNCNYFWYQFISLWNSDKYNVIDRFTLDGKRCWLSFTRRNLFPFTLKFCTLGKKKVKGVALEMVYAREKFLKNTCSSYHIRLIHQSCARRVYLFAYPSYLLVRRSSLNRYRPCSMYHYDLLGTLENKLGVILYYPSLKIFSHITYI